MNDVTGQSGAAPIWHAIMEYIHTRDAIPPQEWRRPPTVVERVVCQTSGLLPTRYCPQVRELFYADPTLGIDTQPHQADTYWKNYSLNVCTGRLATASSPPNCVEDVVFFDYPPEVRAWAHNTGQRMPPAEYDVVDASSPFSPVAIVSPPFLARVSGVIEVRGNAADDSFAYYRLDYGAGTQPDVWLQIGQQSAEPGRDIVMGSWDTTGLSDGAVYTLRLTMVRADNSLETAYVSVTVDNLSPQVTLVEPASGNLYHTGEDVYVPLHAEPEDNVQVAYVEFYRNGELLTTSEEWPYTARWEIAEGGEQTFWAVAYDAAGNSTESEHITINVEP